MNDSKEIEEIILALEEKLLRPQIRCSKKELQRLLDEEFMEFCSSGSVWSYNKEKVIDEQISLDVINWRILDFKIKSLSEGCVLATYQLVKEHVEKKEYSLRSSIWKKQGNQWRMIFHQGTKMNK